jgi:DNA adenine methylase
MNDGAASPRAIRPIIKTPGGKRYLLPRIREILADFPCQDYEYYEPMIGGGAVFFALGHRFGSRFVSDSNADLINLYRVVQGDVEALITELQDRETYYFHHKGEEETVRAYKTLRASDPADPVKRAARILYLLKTCFNGLMRVNGAGRFNSAPGSYVDPPICDAGALRSASGALRDAVIGGPADAIGLLRRLDRERPAMLVIDPPYHHPPKLEEETGRELGKNGGKFTNYSGEFDEDHQTELVRAMVLSRHPFIYTNRATEFVLGLFAGLERALTMECTPLRHSIQPRYTTGVVEQELIVYRL